MDTPEKIYLIDMGDEVVWCEDRQPGAHIDDEDVAEYTLTSVSQAEIDLITDRCATSIKKADAEIDKLKDLIRLRDKYIKEQKAEIDELKQINTDLEKENNRLNKLILGSTNSKA